MINDEFLIKIEKIIEYLEKYGGHNFKLYNHTCSCFDTEPDSDIVKYAEDIRDYWKELKYNEDLEIYIEMEICKIIMDNLKLFLLDDSKLKLLKRYCKSKLNDSIKPTSNELLIEFVNEALVELLNTDVLYDFRDNIE